MTLQLFDNTTFQATGSYEKLYYWNQFNIDFSFLLKIKWKAIFNDLLNTNMILSVSHWLFIYQYASLIWRIN